MTQRPFCSRLGAIFLFLWVSGCAGAPSPHPTRAKAMEQLTSAEELLMKNHPREALASVKNALKMHQLSNDYPSTIDDMNRLSRLSYLLGRGAAAKIWVDRALVLEGVSDYPDRRAETLILAAEMAPAGTEGPWISEAHRVIESLPKGSRTYTRLEARLYQVEGIRASARKDYKGAVPLFKEALIRDLQLDDSLSIATDRAGIARNYYLSGAYETARKEFGEALKLDEKLRNHAGMAYDLEGISLAEAGLGHFRESARSMFAASGIESALGRTALAQRDIAFSRSLFRNIRTPDAAKFQNVLSHWFDPE